MTEMVRAPFSPEQVQSLNEFQRDALLHPFTCSNCRDNLGTRFLRDQETGQLTPTEIGYAELMEFPHLEEQLELLEHTLVATIAGWICPTCDYTQDWAHAQMADWSWWPPSMDIRRRIAQFEQQRV